MICHFCGKEIEVGDRVGRGETCPHCDRDLRICLNCRFYKREAQNRCIEPVAEPVREKDRANFCDYFSPTTRKDKVKSSSELEEARRKAQSLFKE